MSNRLIIFFTLICNSLFAQETTYRFDNDFLSPDFYQNRRALVRSSMPDSSMAILYSSPVKIRSNDTDFPFHQDPSFYYLTGYTEPDCVLLIFKTSFFTATDSVTEILFIQSRDKNKEQWTGRMPEVSEASEISGVKFVLNSSELKDVKINQQLIKRILTLNAPPGLINDKSDSTDLFDLVQTINANFNLNSENSETYLLSHSLKKMRQVKTPEEISLLRKAINISCDGHKEMMRFTETGKTEYQVQAAGEFIFKSKGAESNGYNSICGGGKNSCILHYETNRKTLEKGELLLLDMGAEYHGYSADVTRTIPVSGKFSEEQKIIYNLVLAAHDSALTLCRPGSAFRDPHKKAQEIITTGLLSLNIISNPDDYFRYFMHGTSHYLGLDVHDAGDYGKLTEGNVITVEPGIYIAAGSPCDPKWWNTGVRIEDDILITSTGFENLSRYAPETIPEIENLMKESSILN